ncbi:MAG: DoxX family protein [Acidobacteriota bacterium]
MKKLFGEFIGNRGAIGLLIVRLIFGMGLMLHGYSKIKNPFDWMGQEAPIPGLLQSLAALSEFGGGLALILGLLTPIAAFGITCTMLFAVLGVHVRAGHPFVGSGGPSYELAALYLGVALLMLITGPGKYSLDALVFGAKK